MDKTEATNIQHYVPRFVLRNFTLNKDQVWVFDKQTDRKFKTNIQNIASEKRFHNFSFKNITLTLEPTLSKFESKVSEIITGLIVKKSLSWLNKEDKVILSHFFALQFVRTRQFRLMFKSGFDSLKKALSSRGMDPTKIEGFKELTDDDINLFGIKSIIECREYAPYFFGKTWLLLETTENSPFFISDNPITLQNSRTFGYRGNIGLKVPGIEIYFPLSKLLTLAMFCPTLEEGFRETYKKFKYISTIAPSLVTQFTSETSFLNKIIESFNTGKTMLITNETVLNLNSLQVKYSSRFIFSYNDDFTIVQNMINDNSEFREGPKIKCD